MARSDPTYRTGNWSSTNPHGTSSSSRLEAFCSNTKTFLQFSRYPFYARCPGSRPVVRLVRHYEVSGWVFSSALFYQHGVCDETLPSLMVIEFGRTQFWIDLFVPMRNTGPEHPAFLPSWLLSGRRVQAWHNPKTLPGGSFFAHINLEERVEGGSLSYAMPCATLRGPSTTDEVKF